MSRRLQNYIAIFSISLGMWAALLASAFSLM